MNSYLFNQTFKPSTPMLRIKPYSQQLRKSISLFLVSFFLFFTFFKARASSFDSLKIGFGVSEQILNPIFKMESSTLEKYYQNPFTKFRNHTASLFLQKNNRTLELNYFRSAGLVYFGGIDLFRLYPQWAALSTYQTNSCLQAIYSKGKNYDNLWLEVGFGLSCIFRQKGMNTDTEFDSITNVTLSTTYQVQHRIPIQCIFKLGAVYSIPKSNFQAFIDSKLTCGLLESAEYSILYLNPNKISDFSIFSTKSSNLGFNLGLRYMISIKK